MPLSHPYRLAVLSSLLISMPVRPTLLVIDAVSDPGVKLDLTFAPETDASGGVRRVWGQAMVTATAVARFGEDLPVVWMASVLRKGEFAPNQAVAAVKARDDRFELSFPGEMAISYSDEAWHLPAYDSDLYDVDVGFGMVSGYASWAYSVRGRPKQTIHMEAGAYQVVRSDGSESIGGPVPPNLESWSVPLGARSRLVFDSSGNGTIGPLP